MIEGEKAAAADAQRWLLELAPDDPVRTPSGAVASVVATYPDVGEALVQWSNGARARFRISQLRRPDA